MIVRDDVDNVDDDGIDHSMTRKKIIRIQSRVTIIRYLDDHLHNYPLLRVGTFLRFLQSFLI